MVKNKKILDKESLIINRARGKEKGNLWSIG